MKILLLFALVALVSVISVNDAFADHSEVTISVAQGSGSPGCEASSDGCLIPKEATVDVGGKVIFSNTDNAAHTFTSGNPTDGPSEIFDSGLVPPGGSYEWTPTTEGEFSYFCLVHPWIVGLIVVQEAGAEEPSGDDSQIEYSIIVTTDKTSYKNDDTILVAGEVRDILGSPVSLIMKAPNGDLISIEQLEVGSDKKFSTELTAGGPLMRDSGTYTIQVLYGTESRSDETTFTFGGSTSDDLPNEITITAASGSGADVKCETTAEGCFTPKVASVALGGKVIFSNTDNAAHTFSAGNSIDGHSGIFDSGLVLPGGSYEWTPTTEGEFHYFDMVHPWMAGIILVGEGTYIPPQPDTTFDLQVIMESQVYDLSDTATMSLSINGASTPQNVALEISDPRGTSIISRSFMVDSQVTPFEFRIDENFKTGTYKVVATTSNNGNTITDTAYFKVISQYNSFKITSVQVTDQQGNPSNLQKGEMGFIKVNLDANKPITTLVTVNLFDSELTSIGIGSIKTTLASGNSEIILSFMIPGDVSIGPADIYVNAFSDWPSNGGIPLTGEISVTENIE